MNSVAKQKYYNHIVSDQEPGVEQGSSKKGCHVAVWQVWDEGSRPLGSLLWCYLHEFFLWKGSKRPAEIASLFLVIERHTRPNLPLGWLRLYLWQSSQEANRDESEFSFLEMAVRNTGFQSQWSSKSLNDCTELPRRKWRSIRAKLPVRAQSEAVTVTGHLLCSLLVATGQLSECCTARCSLPCTGFPINQAARQITRVWQALQALAECNRRKRLVFWEGLAEVIKLPGWFFCQRKPFHTYLRMLPLFLCLIKLKRSWNFPVEHTACVRKRKSRTSSHLLTGRDWPAPFHVPPSAAPAHVSFTACKHSTS